MTDYFEVVERDGPSRLGELRLEDEITTPALVGNQIEDYGSLWTDERKTPSGDPGKLSLFPHRAMPPGTPEEVVKEKQPNYDNADFPSAVVVSTEEPIAMGHDLYILTGLREGDSRRVFNAIKKAREELEPDAALMLPGVASPRNVAILSYLGVDAFDTDHAVVSGKQKKYMTQSLEVDLEELSELPCACPVCNESKPSELSRGDVAQHNENMLRVELARVRDRIRNGALREYLEAQVRHTRWQTEVLRLIDQDQAYIEKRTPVARQNKLMANSSESLDRVEVRRFAERVVDRYRSPRSDVLVLLPCSARKPYSESKSHSEFRGAIRGRAHEVVVTSPLGVVPRELEAVYPAGHYDTPVTGRWDAKEKEFVSGVLEEYLKNNSYERVIAHVPREGYGEVVQSATTNTGTDVEYTVNNESHPRDEDTLENLNSTLEGETGANRAMERKWYTRGIADYQFGEGTFDNELNLSGVRTEGRIPRLRLYRGDSQIATVTASYGYLALTLEGINVFNPPTVEIDDFVPEGSVLAPGVLDAPDSIRIGDEVEFRGPSAHGVGRAKMYGEEMRRSTRGVAVDVRHVSEE